MGKIILITGGARSGKSKFAEEYAAKLSDSIGYIATSQIYDQEMAYRVKLHQERRPDTWETFEAPFKAHETITKAFAKHPVLLFDCLTLYLSNYLCQPEKEYSSMETLTKEITELFHKLITAVLESEGTCIFVSNEVGAGIVPENALARRYRDLAGIGNQLIGKAAQEVYFTVAGIPVAIKK